MYSPNIRTVICLVAIIAAIVFSINQWVITKSRTEIFVAVSVSIILAGFRKNRPQHNCLGISAETV
jgi:hypothetical protein